jgi:hypothetical protein
MVIGLAFRTLGVKKTKLLISLSKNTLDTSYNVHRIYHQEKALRSALYCSCWMERTLEKFFSRGQDRSPLKHINCEVCVNLERIEKNHYIVLLEGVFWN